MIPIIVSFVCVCVCVWYTDSRQWEAKLVLSRYNTLIQGKNIKPVLMGNKLAILIKQSNHVMLSVYQNNFCREKIKIST